MTHLTPIQIEQLNGQLRRQLDAAQRDLSACRSACEDGDRGVIRKASLKAIGASAAAEGAHHTLTILANHFDEEET